MLAFLSEPFGVWRISEPFSIVTDNAVGAVRHRQLLRQPAICGNREQLTHARLSITVKNVGERVAHEQQTAIWSPGAKCRGPRIVSNSIWLSPGQGDGVDAVVGSSEGNCLTVGRKPKVALWAGRIG